MAINRTKDELGRTTDTIPLTEEENLAIDIAMVKIIGKSVDAGRALSEADCKFINWGLHELFRESGIAAVNEYAEECRIAKKIKS